MKKRVNLKDQEEQPKAEKKLRLRRSTLKEAPAPAPASFLRAAAPAPSSSSSLSRQERAVLETASSSSESSVSEAVEQRRFLPAPSPEKSEEHAHARTMVPEEKWFRLAQFVGSSGRHKLTPMWKIPFGSANRLEDFAAHELVKEKFRSMSLEELFDSLGRKWLQEKTTVKRKLGPRWKSILIPKAVAMFHEYKGPTPPKRSGRESGFCQYCQKQVAYLTDHQARSACLKNAIVIDKEKMEKEKEEERFLQMRPRDEKGRARMPMSDADVARMVLKPIEWPKRREKRPRVVEQARVEPLGRTIIPEDKWLLLSQFFGKSGRKNLTPKWKIPSGTVLTAENFSKHEIVKEKFRSLCLEEVFRDLGSGWLQEKIGVGSKAALIPKAVVAFGKYKGPAVKRRDGVGSGFCQYCQKQVSSLRNHQARRACLKNVVLGNRGDNKEILEERFRPRDEKGKARMPSISNVDVARVVLKPAEPPKEAKKRARRADEMEDDDDDDDEEWK